LGNDTAWRLTPVDVVVERWGETFAPGVRLDVKATASTPMQLRLVNHNAAVAGAHVAYQLAVRPLAAELQK
jgi:hypothetical protein